MKSFLAALIVLTLAMPPDASACTTTIGPGRSVQGMVSSLSVGQTGCLRQGTYVENVYLGTKRVTLTSAPGARARIAGRVLVDGRGVTVSRLRLDGRAAPACEPTSDCEIKASPTVYASDVRFLDNDVSNAHRATCFLVGDRSRRANRVLIRRNRIHNCGRLPPTNHEHGIYVSASTGFRISDNTVYDNADRGIQLYPDAQSGLVTRNVLDGNGVGIIFGGDESSASGGNVVQRNSVTNSTVGLNVEEDWPGAIGRGNIFRSNCVTGGSPNHTRSADREVGSPRYGVAAFGNPVVDPLYVARSRKDFRLRRGSPCAGKVPILRRTGHRRPDRSAP